MTITREDIAVLVRETVQTTLAEGFEEWEKSQPAPGKTWREKIIGEGDDTLSPARKRITEPEAGMPMARIVLALAATKGDPEKSAAWLDKHYPGDTKTLKALAAGDASAGGFLIVGDTADEVIELLRPASVVRSLNPVLLPMPNGTVTIRKLAGGANASYVGENDDIGVTEPQTGMLRLTWRKLAAIVPVSNDLIRAPSAGAETVVRDDLVNAIAQREDLAFIRDDGTSDTPKGLRFWAPAANVIAANSTVNLANVTEDLANLLLQLRNADVRMLRPGWIMAPRSELFLMTVRDGNGNFAFRDEMLTGSLWGFPFRTTTQIPINLAGDESEVYIVDFADAVIGEADGLMLDASNEASYVENSNVVSAFSRDQTVIRAIELHDFGMRHDASVAVLNEVTWAP